MRPSLRLPRQPLLGADVTYVTHWECVRNGTQWPWNAVDMEYRPQPPMATDRAWERATHLRPYMHHHTCAIREDIAVGQHAGNRVTMRRRGHSHRTRPGALSADLPAEARSWARPRSLDEA